VGLPCYLTGQFTGTVHLKVAANIGIVVISFLIPLIAVRSAGNAVKASGPLSATQGPR